MAQCVFSTVVLDLGADEKLTASAQIELTTLETSHATWQTDPPASSTLSSVQVILFAVLAFALRDMSPAAPCGSEPTRPPVEWVILRERTRVTSRECQVLVNSGATPRSTGPTERVGTYGLSAACRLPAILSCKLAARDG